jgi:hypothetical protein
MQMVVRKVVGNDLVVKNVALKKCSIKHRNQPEPTVTVSELSK